MQESLPVSYIHGNVMLDAGIDAISAIVEAGEAEGRGFVDSAPAHVIRESRDLLEQARRDGGFHASLPRALELVRQHPHTEILQINAARLITEAGDRRHALAVWRALQQRFPESIESFRLYVRMVRATGGDELAAAAVDERFPGFTPPSHANGIIILGMALEELGRIDDAEAAFEEAKRIDPSARSAWRRLAHLQQARGSMRAAQRTLEAGYAATGDKAMGRSLDALRRNIDTLESFSPTSDLRDSPSSVAAIQYIVRQLMPARQSLDLRARDTIGSCLFVAGSLGSGGAERQLTIASTGLHEAARTAIPIDGVDVLGPVAVCCRQLNSRYEYDFYRPAIEAAGVPVDSYMHTEPYGGRIQASVARPFAAAIEFLPIRMQEGMLHLADYLRDAAPDVVNIWQDGMIVAGGLAALAANVPRIVLSVRSQPPSERLNRWKLETEPVYRALLSAPGVVLTANSATAARSYENWLGLDRYSVPVIPNGVDPLASDPADNDAARWETFAAQTASDAPFTVGSIMRLDDNKRPFDWLDIAARFHATHPCARFIFVGDGPLMAEAEECAARHGLRERVLFTGRSRSVGYWLSRMDALMLTSRFEGTPNVLIEAQVAGVPVVTTPAGGAAETVRHGVTGYVLSTLESIDVDEASGFLSAIVRRSPTDRADMSDAAREWATANYSVQRMLERTVATFAMDVRRPLLQEGMASEA